MFFFVSDGTVTLLLIPLPCMEVNMRFLVVKYRNYLQLETFFYLIFFSKFNHLLEKGRGSLPLAYKICTISKIMHA